MNKLLLRLFVSLFVLISTVTFAQNIHQGVNLDEVKAGKYDNGKMWTFDNPPLEYFKEAYGFTPTQEWLDHARMSALKFATYCSASFVSEDGLVMTNHHCGRENVTKVSKDNENLAENGFYAGTLAEERKVPDLFVDQLVQIIDVTKEIQAETDKGKTEEEKIKLRDTKIENLEKEWSDKTGNVAQVVSFYSGGQYSVYIYKRYNDVRLVFAPENQAGYFGGDYDNFTYPRYNLDVTYFRVYENDKPLKTEYFFKWSKNGADSGDVIFVVGNPASTGRLKSTAELEYMRDYLYPKYLELLGKALVYQKMAMENASPSEKQEAEDNYFSMMNSLKVVNGIVKGLNDPILMARKKDFEKTFWSKIESNSKLKEKYGYLKNEIKETVKNLLAESKNMTGNPFNPPENVKKIQNSLDAKNMILGKALYEVYGNSIPPDATFTLRLADGVISSYDYNGTIAPVFTTFYGIYDRYFGFKKQYPYNLPERWKKPPPEFKLETPFNFISTNDIIGGNSGSPVINKDGEVVGLAFDGNIESLPSDFIYTTEANRMIAVDSRGLTEVVKNLYKATKLYEELINGKISD